MTMHRFDVAVPASGYAWWYLDALSADGRHGLTLIAFVGSVFSPYYAWARGRGGGTAEAENHCAMNLALYDLDHRGGTGGWAMTERGRASVQRSAQQLRIGASAIAWDDDGLRVDIDEVTVPWPRRLRGTIRLRTGRRLDHPYPLDAAGRHVWCPIAPHAAVEVDFPQPGVRWQGTGYLDSNFGELPLAQDFQSWDWSRADLPGGHSAVLYDVRRRDGSTHHLAVRFDAEGGRSDFTAPPRAALPSSGWRVARETRCDAEGRASVARTLEDGPFYARSVLQSRLLGHDVTAVHESLCLQRWARPVVQLMLPFRMPRRA